MDCLFKNIISVEEIYLFSLPLLVTNSNKLKIKAARMSHLSPQSSPLSRRIAICKLNKIKSIIYILHKFRS